jgi:hypothetical protein
MNLNPVAGDVYTYNGPSNQPTWEAPQSSGGSGSSVVTAVSSFPVGGSDDTVQLQNALTWLQGAANRAIALQAGQIYTISSALTLAGASFFRIMGNGATIKASASMPVQAGYQLLYVTTSTDGSVSDLTFDANRSVRTPNASVTAQSVYIYTGCQRLKFTNCSSNNAVVDGWYIGSATPTVLASLPTDIVMSFCGAQNAFRNNVSVINSVRFRDYYGVYTGANGALPMNGIDVEPNSSSDQGNQDARFYGTRCDGNSGYGIQIVNPNSNARLFDVSMSSNLLGAVGGSWGFLQIEGITVEGYIGGVSNGIINCAGGTGETHIRRVLGRNNNTASDALPLIYVNGTNTGPVTITDVQAYSSTCAVLNALAAVQVNGIAVTGANSEYVFILQGSAAGSSIRNVSAVGVVAIGYISCADVTVEGVTNLNPTGTEIQLYYANGATDGSLRNFEVTQQTAIPAGQIGVRFNSAPAFVDNIVGKCDGTAWTAAQLCVFQGGTVGSFIGNVSTNPRVLQTYTVATLPASPAAGSTAYASNGRKVGEGAGSGTGVPVYFSNGSWRVSSTDVAVTS